MEKKFDPLAWAAASKNNAAKDNGQIMADQVINHQSCALAQPRTENEADAKAELLKVIRKLLSLGANIAESYHDWWRLGCALAWELGVEGREYFHRLSALSAKYNERECEAKWRECLRVSDGRTTRGTIFWMAEQAGIDIAVL